MLLHVPSSGEWFDVFTCTQRGLEIARVAAGDSEFVLTPPSPPGETLVHFLTPKCR